MGKRSDLKQSCVTEDSSAVVALLPNPGTCFYFRSHGGWLRMSSQWTPITQNMKSDSPPMKNGLCSSIATIPMTINSFGYHTKWATCGWSGWSSIPGETNPRCFPGLHMCWHYSRLLFMTPKNGVNLCKIANLFVFLPTANTTWITVYTSITDSLAQRCPRWRQYIRRTFKDRWRYCSSPEHQS